MEHQLDQEHQADKAADNKDKAADNKETAADKDKADKADKDKADKANQEHQVDQERQRRRQNLVMLKKWHSIHFQNKMKKKQL